MTESKGNNTKSMNAKVMVFALCMSSMLIDIYMKLLEDILNRFQVTELNRFCEVPREIT